MFDTFVEYYDLIYAGLKDYDREARDIATLLRRLNPRCRSILDVGCGTGEHASRLEAAGFEVDGIDVHRRFVQIARRKLRQGHVYVEDMADFSLGRQYDAVICLFSSIGYLRTLDRVEAALTCFRDHLATGGVVVIEPWFTPGVLDPARTSEDIGEGSGIRVVRRGRIDIADRLSRLIFDYEISEAAGTRHASEVHELGLFETAELLAAFARSGLDATYQAGGLTDRGLFVARRAGALQLVPYDPAWPDQFKVERNRIGLVLGPLALRIVHHGSTAVPGLAAKPVIDIQVSVAKLHPIDTYAAALARLGYVHVPHADDAVCPFFHRPAEWPHTHHVHVVEAGGDEERRTLAFRDYLCDHDEVARAYEELKQRLATQTTASEASSREQYATAKSAFIAGVTERALAAGYPRDR
jgi:GrpB-like predicted nucleotidyltransferase (UPF0157 family)